MSERDPQPDRPPLPLEVEQQIDRLCDEFELAWKGGYSPRIEDFLCRLPVAARAIGLRELLAQEIDLRQSGDELCRLRRNTNDGLPTIIRQSAMHSLSSTHGDRQSTTRPTPPLRSRRTELPRPHVK